MAGLGTTELIIILVIIMVLFGAAKLPKLARSLGESSREFKKGLNEGANEGEAPTEPKPDAKS